ncbi:MAG: chloramphenicol acetyltransferase [Oscillospiraceae bacterium]|nr:chloramphenicol acetyltransferase [Oscillospiraceae bacterium]
MNGELWENWERREIFDFFSRISDPFYSVGFRLDVTRLHDFCKERGLSFYYALVWLSTKAINDTEAFSFALREGELVRLDGRRPSFTDLKKGAERFHIVTMPAGDSLEDFCRAAKEKSAAQDCFIDLSQEGDDLIFLSCLPWLDLTSLTNERDFDADDAIPRLAWGKYVRRDGRLELGYSVEVNHRFIDGLHIGLFAASLQALIDAL